MPDVPQEVLATVIEALRLYADETNWYPTEISAVDNDGGHHAREALRELEAALPPKPPAPRP